MFNIYNINWNKFAALLLPTSLRNSTLISFLISFFEPLKVLWNLFLLFRLEQLYQTEINCQTVKLERVLNDTYDPIERRIFISPGTYYDPPVFYEEYKNRPVVFYDEGDTRNPIFYSTDSLNNRVSFNFFVNVPSDVFFEKIKIAATVTKYKNISRTFDIIII